MLYHHKYLSSTVVKYIIFKVAINNFQNIFSKLRNFIKRLARQEITEEAKNKNI